MHNINHLCLEWELYTITDHKTNRILKPGKFFQEDAGYNGLFGASVTSSAFLFSQKYTEAHGF